jgi:hypothetical protein
MARSEAAGMHSVDGTSLQRGLSDHQSFIDAGMPAILFHAEPDNAYHTDRDVIERVQVDYLDLMGGIALSLIRLVH